MKKVMFRLVVVTVVFLIGNVLFGQSKKNVSQNKTEEESYLSLDINYVSDAVFMGRKDSIAAPYVYPSATYHHKSGFYTRGAFSYLTKPDQNRVDVFLISGGYDFISNKLYGDFSVTKYVFDNDSYNVISEVEADVTANLRYDFNVVNVSLSASTYFNNNNSSDFFLSSELSHDFMTSNNKFQCSPTVGVYLGSQNFYEEYYINNRFGSGGRGPGNGTNMQTTTTDVVIQESEKFNVMAIEFGLPMWYTNKSLTFSFLPALVLPQSEAIIIVDDALTKEDLKETFYWMAGISYRF